MAGRLKCSSLRAALAAMIGLWSGVGTASAATSTQTVTSGPVTATLTITYSDGFDDLVNATDASLAITRSDGGPTVTWPAAALEPDGLTGFVFQAKGAVTLRDLDGDGEPEVLMETFTGGAHCCSITYVGWRSPATNTYQLTREFWGDIAPRLKDLDVNGTPEFVGVDDRFAYTFASYAATVFPLRIWAFHSGRFIDVTRSSPVIARREMKATWKEYLRFRRNGYPVWSALAAYIANSYSTGGGYPAVAWRRAKALEGKHPRMLRRVRNQLTRWGYIPPK